MTQKEVNLSDPAKKSPERSKFDLFSFLYISVILLAQAGLFILLFLHYYNPDEYPKFNAFFSIYLLIALVNLTAFAGLLMKRSFGKVLTSSLLTLEMVMSLNFPANLFIVAVPISLVAIYLLGQNITAFKPQDRKDKYVYALIILLLIAYVANFIYSQNLPKAEPYASQVTKEAIEKNDVTICDKISGGDKRRCITALAVNKRNSNLCNLVDFQQDKDQCSSDVNNAEMDTLYDDILSRIDSINITECWHLEGSWRDKCIKEFANNRHTPQFCNNISLEYIKADCTG